jgi:hypothetical protein
MSTGSTSLSRSCTYPRWRDTTLKIAWRHVMCHGDVAYQLYLALFVQRAWLERSDALLNDRCKRSGAARETSLAAHPGAADRLAHVKTDDDMKIRIHLRLRLRSSATQHLCYVSVRIRSRNRATLTALLQCVHSCLTIRTQSACIFCGALLITYDERIDSSPLYDIKEIWLRYDI